MEESSKRSPVLLIATEGEWAGRSLESVLERHGYVILRAEDGRDALGRALRRQPDAVILDEHLPGLGGIEVCQLLRQDPSFDPATPIIITAPAPASRAVRSAAYRAGAWDFCTQPLDTHTLLLQLSTFIRAKRALAEARAQSFVEGRTGLLTADGMERWAEQLAARASRNHEPLACVVMMPATPAPAESSLPRKSDGVTAAVAGFLRLSRESFRRSDIVGRTRDGRLALLAPDTDSDGVHGLLARLRGDVEAASLDSRTPSAKGFRAGYWAVQDFASAPLEPSELLRRAARALDHVYLLSEDNLSIGFDQLPLS